MLAFETIFVLTAGGRSYAVNAHTGELRWKRELETITSNAGSSPALGADGKLYFVLGSGFLQAVDARTGEVESLFNLGELASISSPAIGPDGTLYIGASRSRVRASILAGEFSGRSRPPKIGPTCLPRPCQPTEPPTLARPAASTP